MNMPSNHHEIEIKVKGNQVRAPTHIPEMDIGDTVHYFFKGTGKPSIIFPAASPYRTDQKANTRVTDAETLTIKQAGKFPSGCQIELANGTIIGWDPNDPDGTKESGGDHNVRKPKS